MTPWERLDKEITRKRLAWVALADSLGLTKQNIGHWKTRGIPAKYMRGAASFVGKSLEWLEFGDAEKAAINISVGMKNKPDELVIPQFDTGGAMGDGLILRDQPGIINGWSVNQEWIAKNVRSHSGVGNLCIVTGFGDSMRPMFNPGDPLLVDAGVKTVEFDSVYFFRVENEGFVKRLQRIPGEGIRVLSANKEYDPWTIKHGMDFEVFGRVLKAWRGEEF